VAVRPAQARAASATSFSSAPAGAAYPTKLRRRAGYVMVVPPAASEQQPDDQRVRAGGLTAAETYPQPATVH
jgi:hypothetical protein